MLYSFISILNIIGMTLKSTQLNSSIVYPWKTGVCHNTVENRLQRIRLVVVFYHNMIVNKRVNIA